MTDPQILLENLLNALAAGLVIGCLYGLMCVGLATIFGIMRMVKFAQGEILTLSMYVGFFLFGGVLLGYSWRRSPRR